MGILDYKPLEEFKPKKQFKVDVKCERCGSIFRGQEWMLKSNREIICPRCYEYEQLDI